MLIYFAGGAANVAAAVAMLHFHILAVNMDLLE
jgi:hypothetical protein